MSQVLTLLVLLALMLGFDGLSPEVSRFSSALDPKSLAATGFIILAAFTVGELSRRVRLPALIGYLGAGLLFGPSLTELLGLSDVGQIFSREAIRDLELVNVLAVGVVGTMGGCEIHFGELRRSWRTILLVFSLVLVIVLPSSALMTLGLSQAVPSLLPFFKDLPLDQVIAGSTLIGVLAMGMSPAATIALLQETGGKGPFSSLVLGIVVVADMVLVALFLIVLALTKLTIAPEGLSTAGALTAMPAIAAEFGWAAVLGVITGLLFILYLRFVKHEVMLFSLGLIFVASYAAQILHAETLLVFLAAGFIVQNFSRYGHDLLHAFEQIALPVFIVYFTTQAAGLDLAVMTTYLPVALILVATRVLALALSVRWGARFAGTDDRTQRHLWLCFFSQGGVDLVLAGQIAAYVPGWGKDLQTLITTTVIIYLFLGPPLFKAAIERVGESTSARERGLENLSSAAAKVHVAAVADFPAPEVADPSLATRLWGLREALEGLSADLIHARLGDRAGQLRAGLEGVARASAAFFAAASAADEAPGPARGPGLAEARVALSAAIDAELATWTTAEPSLLTAADLHQLLQTIEGMERFSSTFVVEREARLFENAAGDRGWLRLIKRGRRLRRRLFGAGVRTIPLGRLWRYHAAMGVPIALYQLNEASLGEYWEQLDAHLRALVDLPLEAASPGEIEAAQAASEARLGELLAHQKRIEEELLGDLSRTVVGAFENLLEAVATAGTIELPAYRYRPSRRFDAALAARSEITSRREREALIARGARDHLLAWIHTRALIRATLGQFESLETALRERLLAPTFAGIEGLRRAAEAPLDDAIPSHLASVLRPALILAGHGVARSEALVGDGHHTRILAANLHTAIATIPIDLEPSPPGARKPGPIALQRWLHLEVEVEASLLVHEANERLTSLLRQQRIELDRLRAVTDYYLEAAKPQGSRAPSPETAEALAEELRESLPRLTQQFRDFADDLAAGVNTITEELQRTVAEHLRQASAPVLEGRYAMIQRRLGEHAQVGTRGQLRRLWHRLLGRFARLRPIFFEISAELGALFSDGGTPTDPDGYRELLTAARATNTRIPLLYRRLFGPAADTSELLVERPEAQAALAATIERWQGGLASCVLIRGDRGAGKRTLVRHKIPALEAAGARVVWLRLTSKVDDEASIAGSLAALAGLAAAETFDVLADRLVASARPQVIIIENGERLFKRTSEGSATLQRFLTAMRRTTPTVMWWVMISESGAAMIDRVVALHTRFDATIHLAPLDAEGITSLLLARHRLSGYTLEYTRARRRPLERMLSPLLDRRQRDHENLRNLHFLSGGNPRHALTLWLAAAEPQAANNRVLIRPIPRTRAPLIDGAELEERLLLAALVQHGALRPSQLAEIRQHPVSALDAALVRLRSRGLLAHSASDPEALMIPPHLVHPITLELRQHNLV